VLLVPQLGTAIRQTSGQRAAPQLSRRDLTTFLFFEFYDVTDYYVFVIFVPYFIAYSLWSWPAAAVKSYIVRYYFYCY